VNLPLGYRYASTHAGIRRDTRDDVALIVSDKPAAAAAVFTQNAVQAAPVRLARAHIRKGKVSAVLVNAGNANCATRTGDRVALASCKAAAKVLKTKTEYVLPASTGVIGVELETKLITNVLPELAKHLAADRFLDVAKAIMTTDTRMKIATEAVQLKGGTVRIAGMTKGSGMIHPDMATTLGFVMTDVELASPVLRSMLADGVASSYNSLTVDGDMSTNDMLALLANGASGVKPSARELKTLQEATKYVMESLAEQIAADGEGARKLIIVRALGWKNSDDAKRVARAIANSPLVKTAIAGSDPNWGRILCAAGYAGVTFDPADVSVFLQDVEVCREGLAAEYDEPALKTSLDQGRVTIRVQHKKNGKGEARFFTCDLTEGYIQINGSYRT
jgi:glutamate N-acetyltransferase / amino-acid N-acetyltransferase